MYIDEYDSAARVLITGLHDGITNGSGNISDLHKIQFYSFMFQIFHSLPKIAEDPDNIHHMSADLDILNGFPEVREVIREYAREPDFIKSSFIDGGIDTYILDAACNIEQAFIDYAPPANSVIYNQYPELFNEFVCQLLELNPHDNVASLFCSPDNFLITEEYVKKHQVDFGQNDLNPSDLNHSDSCSFDCISYTSFEGNKEKWAFHVLRNFILQGKNDLYRNFKIKNAYIDTGYDLYREGFNKVFAFPPIYRGKRSQSLGGGKVTVNIEQEYTDRTDYYFERIHQSFTENGRAVVLVSDSFFTNRYRYLMKDLFNRGLIKAIIHLPPKSIQPVNIKSSFIVLEKQFFSSSSESNRFIKFIDLSMARFSHSRDLRDEYKALFNKALKDYRNEDADLRSDITIVVPYQKIFEDNYKMNYSWDDIKRNENTKKISSYFLSNPAARFVGYGDEVSEIIYDRESFPTTYSLNDEAKIYRGNLDLKADDIVDENAEGKIGRLIRIADIADNRIKDISPRFIIKDEEQESQALHNGDIVISKLLPLKVAVVNTEEKLFAGTSLMVIRLNEDSNLNPYYLKGYLESEEGLNLINCISSGGSVSALTLKNLSSIYIPAVPKDVQKKYEKEYKMVEAKIVDCERQLREMRDYQLGLVGRLETL